MPGTMDKYQICVFIIVFFVILVQENVCLDTKIFFLRGLETEILKHVCSGGHFKKWPTLGQSSNLRICYWLFCNTWS